MNLDLRYTPFSRFGSYMAFSVLDKPESRGLFLRNLHGDAVKRLVFKLELTRNGKRVPFKTAANATRMTLSDAKGRVDLCFEDAKTLRFQGKGVGLRFSVVHGERYDYASCFPIAKDAWQLTHFGNRMNYLCSRLQGLMRVDAPMGEARCLHIWADFEAERPGGAFQGRISEFRTVPGKASAFSSYQAAQKAADQDFEAWLKRQPNVPSRYAETRRLAAYVNYATCGAAEGHLRRTGMFMSKNWMNQVWSWDHCFNAMALWYRHPGLSWDQVMAPFDLQDASGQLPDSYNDVNIGWNFCKPPIHGWALNWLWQRRPELFTSARLREIYGPTVKWTRWWTSYRDSDGDGLPDYHHGNDSGWDNATPFDVGFPLEGPDLPAFLVLQMELLAKMATKLGKRAEAKKWRNESEAMLQRLFEHHWRDGRFICPRSGDHKTSPGDSLFNFLPIMLGQRLGPEKLGILLKGMKQRGRFLTKHGLATESQKSRFYQDDGYWRGPIWAPTTLMLVDALRSAGEVKFSKELARRFCDMVAANGMAENFDAKSGKGLRDRGYTWTASVFLVLAHEYL
jgi:glycogen debranching enzyme